MCGLSAEVVRRSRNLEVKAFIQQFRCMIWEMRHWNTPPDHHFNCAIQFSLHDANLLHTGQNTVIRMIIQIAHYALVWKPSISAQVSADAWQQWLMRNTAHHGPWTGSVESFCHRTMFCHHARVLYVFGVSLIYSQFLWQALGFHFSAQHSVTFALSSELVKHACDEMMK